MGGPCAVHHTVLLPTIIAFFPYFKELTVFTGAIHITQSAQQPDRQQQQQQHHRQYAMQKILHDHNKEQK